MAATGRQLKQSVKVWEEGGREGGREKGREGRGDEIMMMG